MSVLGTILKVILSSNLAFKFGYMSEIEWVLNCAFNNYWSNNNLQPSTSQQHFKEASCMGHVSYLDGYELINQCTDHVSFLLRMV